MEHRYVSSTSSSHVYIRCPLKTDPFDHYEMSLWAFSRFSLSVESSCCTVPRLQLSALAALYKENPPCCDGRPITQLQGNRNHFPNISVWWSTFASPLALLGSSVHPLANNNRSRFDSRGFLIKFASIKSNYIEHKDWIQAYSLCGSIQSHPGTDGFNRYGDTGFPIIILCSQEADLLRYVAFIWKNPPTFTDYFEFPYFLLVGFAVNVNWSSNNNQWSNELDAKDSLFNCKNFL